ncbi:MAG: PASTA domain-containing protein, partial [Spirochaetaceae bacterium]|nr:PASTA domain-containing protein [Spirochaetaceae bacterium]
QDGKAAGAFIGVVVEKVAGRIYPEKRLASHLVGFVGDGNRGLAGVENKYEADLSPSPAPAPASASGVVRGNQVVLSIDSALQYSLEEIARKAMTDTGAEAVMLLAGDARTGEILSYVAMPDFDPNEYYKSPAETWSDWPSVYAYEPGSVFKVFTTAAAMDLGGIDRSTTFVCDGAYRKKAPSGEEIVIKCLGVHGTVDVERILELSCNAGAAYVADTVQSLDFYERLTAFGFGARTGVALPGESPGLLRSPDSWSLRSKPTIGMGQEVLVTAVQMLAAATAVANGGVLMKPISVLRVLGPDGTLVYENAPQAVRRVVSADTAKAILGAMELVSGEGGTGRRAKVKDVRMAVKTGTAQMADRATRRYSETDYIASTVAILPAEDPRVVLYLAIVKPKGESYYGGRIAAPVIREAAEAVLSLSDIPRADSPTVVHPGTISLPRLEAATVGDTMPDLRGLPKRLLLPLLERRDLKVRIAGEGYVRRQKPEPGAPVPAGTEIILELE